MKYLILYILTVGFAITANSQDHSGAYGYTLKLEGLQPPKDKSAIPGGQLVLQKMEGYRQVGWNLEIFGDLLDPFDSIA